MMAEAAFCQLEMAQALKSLKPSKKQEKSKRSLRLSLHVHKKTLRVLRKAEESKTAKRSCSDEGVTTEARAKSRGGRRH